MKRRDFLKITTATIAAKMTDKSGHAEGEKDGSHKIYRAVVYPTNLRCEYRVDPLGIDITEPHLSWMTASKQPEERSQMQAAFQIVVSSSPRLLMEGTGDLWDSEKVASDKSTHIQYKGRPIAARQIVWWRVRIWDQHGRSSEWSRVARWSLGLTQPTDWTGKWIGMDGGEEDPDEFQGAQWISSHIGDASVLRFRGSFTVDEQNEVSYGQLAVVGTNEITVYVNGTKILPFSGKFPKNYLSYFLTKLIRYGNNVVGVELTSDKPANAVMAGIELDLSNGDIQRVHSDTNWKVSDQQDPGWEQPEFDDVSWSRCTSIEKPLNFVENAKTAERTRLPARMVRKAFQLSGEPHKATVYVSGLGYFELYVNGKKVGNDVLTPALTDYDKRVYYLTYEVAHLLQRGDNAVGVTIGNGRFYAPRRYIPFPTRTFGFPKVLLQMDIECSDGSCVAVVSDETWKITDQGPIRANNDYDGEEYDARMEELGWTTPGFDDNHWKSAQTVDPPRGKVYAQMSDPIRVTHELKSVRLTQPKPGIFIFDMGQNMVGWCRLSVAGPRGTRITLRHAEVLRPDGMLYLDNLRSARQIDTYTLKGAKNEIYEPRFTYHGFQYVELRGFPGSPTLETLTGMVVSDALEEHAVFATSSAALNQIYRNVLWGDRGNYRSIPADCPQRDERQGWLGDRSAESKGESFMFNVSNFYSKWMQDIADSIDSEGRINDLAPAYWPIYNENVVWPASFFIIPKMLYQQYGDIEVIRKQYAAMKRWVRHMQAFIKDNLMPVDVYGDWCVPPKSPTLIHSDDPASQTAPEILGTAYFYHILTLMSEFATIQKLSEDQRLYDDLAIKVKTAFNSKFFDAEANHYGNGSQTSSVLPVALGLAPEVHKRAIVDTLARKIVNSTHGHVGTGLVGSQWLLQTLTSNGYADIAFRIASQITYPGWGYMVSRGATTIWELWNGDTADPAMNSRNHLMLVGDLCTWFYENLAGIKSDQDRPGFKHIFIQPSIVNGLDFVRASHRSLHGEITTEWHKTGTSFTLHLSIPPNTTATVYVPTSNRASIRESGRAAEVSNGVRFVNVTPDATVFEIGSGNYAFSSILG
jgi:alpha-L-rhamnosidase